MTGFLQKLHDFLFPSCKTYSEILSLLKEVSEDQTKIHQKINALENICAEKELSQQQLHQTLNRIREEQEKLSLQEKELLLSMTENVTAVGKHLNVISNTQNANHQESLGYIRDVIQTVNKIFDLATFSRSVLADCSTFPRKLEELKSVLDGQKSAIESSLRELTDQHALLRQQTASSIETLTGRTEHAARLLEEQNKQTTSSLAALSSTEKLLEETSNRLSSIQECSEKTFDLLNVRQEPAMEQILHRTNELEATARQLAQQLEDLQKQTIRTVIQSKWLLADEFSSQEKEKEDAIIRCPLCGHSGKKSSYETRTTFCIFGGGKIERYVCPACDLIFGPLKMLKLSPQQLQEEYEQNYSVFRESDTTPYELALFHAMKPEKDRIYLNYGAGGWNATSRKLREEGFQVYDYEPFAPVQKNEWSITSKAGLRNMKFDGIFSNDLIEHLQNPVEELCFMKSLLNPDGKMYHATGCYEYAFEYTRFHLFFFLGRSLQLLAQKSGLEVKLTDRIYPEQSSLRYAIFTIKNT